MNLNDTIPYLNIDWWHLIIAIVLLAVGYLAIKVLLVVLKRVMLRMHLPELLIDFLSRVLKVLLYLVLILVFLGALGFETGSALLAMSAIVGLVLGFGLQDTMNNFFAGVWLALIRPFKKDDWITVNGFSGKIDSIGMMSTVIITADNTYITLPNKSVWGSPITNTSHMPTRRVGVPISVSPNTDLDKAISVAMDLMVRHPLVLKDPSPAVAITGLDDDKVNLNLRAWVNNSDYWTVNGDLSKGIVEEFRRNGVELPLPRRDIHIRKEE
ncbi:mechanosensitive ion channel protein MscS [Methanomassiliicoccales archaeon RumEn M1]|nr:mechanosensitive ion channel protein MscS [Methanomassiliicoccales archaeon RumEn M1]